MINKQFINDNIESIQELLGEIKSFREYELEDIVQNFHLYASLRYAFIELIERAIDINQHIIREGSQDIPKDYTDTFTILAKMSVLENDFAKEISKSVGLRNVVVHEYRDVDDERLYNSIDIALDQYPTYCEAVMEYAHR